MRLKVAASLVLGLASASIASACQPTPQTSKPESLHIFVDPQGRTFLNGKQVTEAQIEALSDVTILKAEDAEKIRISAAGKTVTLEEYLESVAKNGAGKEAAQQ